MKKLYNFKVDGPVYIVAELVDRHPDGTLTFNVKDSAWLESIGWKPDAHVEVQALPVTQNHQVGEYYWVEPMNLDGTPFEEAPTLGNAFFEDAILTRPGESLIDTVQSARSMETK